MKIECELCHVTAEMAEFVPRSGGMDVKCGACGQWFLVKQADKPADAPVVVAPYRTPQLGPGCPKCGRPRGPGEACPRCGLVYEKWTPEVGSVGALDERAAALWADVERGWTDEARHDVFIQYCMRSGLLAGAGRRYRERLDREPGEPVATKMQEKIITMATQILGPHSQAKEPVTRAKWFGWVLAAAAVGAAVVGMIWR